MTIIPLMEEIKRKITDATEEQINRFATQLKRLGKIEAFFEKFNDECGQFEELLNRARKALNYTKPYRIAVIGTTGAGKSTLINALLGRPLVLTKPISKPATGAALEIFLDVHPGGAEKALVTYRNAKDISNLIREFVERYKLDESSLKGNLDANFASLLSRLEPKNELSEQQRDEFIKLRKTITEIIIEYGNNISKELKTDFSLEDSRDREYLMELIDENSSLNNENSTSRLIGLVKTVSYHIQPDSSFGNLSSLQLPGNVCLVDLPGLDGTPLHDIIISEGIKDADAVIFILGGRRILGRGDSYLLNRVRKYISVEGSTESGDRIFLVLNAIDSIMVDNIGKLDNLPRDMQDLMDFVVPGYATHSLLAKRGGDTPYFLTSALAAYAAQQRLKGNDLEDRETYEAIKIKLKVQGGDDSEVLEASQIPRLVKELTRFIRERRIEGQINDGKQTLDIIIDSLDKKYNKNSSATTSRQTNLLEKMDKYLSEKQALLKDIVYDFQQKQINNLGELRQKLEREAIAICNLTDSELHKKLPSFWQEYFQSKRSELQGERIGKVFYEVFLDKIQLELWKQLNRNLPRLASYLIGTCTSNLETSQVAEKIAHGFNGYLETTKVKSELQIFVNENTSNTIEKMSERIAVTVMTRPDLFFTATLTDSKQPKQKQLFENISKIPHQPNVSLSDFNALIEEIRKLYHNFVVKDCVNLLSNLYLYEITLIKDYLVSVIDNAFYEARNNSNPVFIEKIRESLNLDEDWKQMQLLEQKRNEITQLKLNIQS